MELKQETKDDLAACGFSFCERHGVWYKPDLRAERMIEDKNSRLKEQGEHAHLVYQEEVTSCPVCQREKSLDLLNSGFECMDNMLSSIEKKLDV